MSRDPELTREERVDARLARLERIVLSLGANKTDLDARERLGVEAMAETDIRGLSDELIDDIKAAL